MRIPCMLRDELITCGKKGIRIHTNSFVAVCVSNCSQMKLTISISKKLGKAHERNKVKRRIYNIMHHIHTNKHFWFKLNAKNKPYISFAYLMHNINLLKRQLRIV
jgi:RNase P protein component